MFTLSVSSSTSGSPASTTSPSCFSQEPIVASVTDSPRAGTRTSTGMAHTSLQNGLHDSVDDAPLLGGVRVGPALGRAGHLWPSNIAWRKIGAQDLAQAPLHEGPGAHVA